jgi:hypothetical protein
MLKLGDRQLQGFDHLIPHNHHRLQGGDVGGQWGSGLHHGASIAASRPIADGFAFRAPTYPATCGRARATRVLLDAVKLLCLFSVDQLFRT